MVRRSIITVGVSVLAAACSSNVITRSDATSNSNLLASGNIVISRPVPEAQISTLGVSGFGFWPMYRSVLNSGPELVIDIERSLIQDTFDPSIEALQTQQNNHPVFLNGPLTAGLYAVSLIQHSPLWYAPDSYYERRGLEVPTSGSRERYLRGALGEVALFLDSGVVVHSGEVRSEEIEGVQVSPTFLSKMAKRLKVGSVIQVK